MEDILQFIDDGFSEVKVMEANLKFKFVNFHSLDLLEILRSMATLTFVIHKKSIFNREVVFVNITLKLMHKISFDYFSVCIVNKLKDHNYFSLRSIVKVQQIDRVIDSDCSTNNQPLQKTLIYAPHSINKSTSKGNNFHKFVYALRSRMLYTVFSKVKSVCKALTLRLLALFSLVVRKVLSADTTYDDSFLHSSGEQFEKLA